ncbi:hypothetical protein D5R81_04370 [Parashewanella spongiae]|uniref:Uncharacterized protein n=1 Tax=Parashewanella spongiae TaxID=342950 RepID=A0A3A6UHV9_9GAMM|nr:hypothetical protein [Parashewanella spongiae]MCL1077509.1 hypothetical protein [Parashewanella spongiae]RJY18634.1 hypothetical protein D5R81_04370 [Parashewanella spongiae]
MATHPTTSDMTTTQFNYPLFSLESVKRTAPAAILGFAVTGGNPWGLLTGASAYNLISSYFGSNPKMISVCELSKYVATSVVGVAIHAYLSKSHTSFKTI